MSISIEQDLKDYLMRLEAKIDCRFDKIETTLNTVQNEVIELKVSMGKIETQLNNLEKKVDSIETEQKALIQDVSDNQGAKSLDNIVKLLKKN